MSGKGGGEVGTILCDLSHDAFNVPNPPAQQTHACENITLPQLRLRTVKIQLLNMCHGNNICENYE